MKKWNGAERRKDMPEIMERLSVLETLQQRDLDEATEWRKAFCAKVDKILDKLNSLPCDLREGRYLSQTIQLKWIWATLGIFITLECAFIVAIIRGMCR